MQLPSTKQLRYLVALDEHRHFGKAAQACAISQSGFSIAIRELEEILGIQLIDRTNKTVTITPSGKQIVAKARICLRDIESLMQLPRDFHPPLAGKLTLGVIPTVAPYLLPEILMQLPGVFPGLKLYLKEQLTHLLYDELMAGYIDLMLVALPYEFKHVEILPLFKDPFLLVHHKDSKWLDERADALGQVKEDSVLLLEDGHCLREHALSACKLRHTNKVSQFAATSLHTMLYMVCNDLGVTFIPALAQESLGLFKDTLTIRALPEDASFREIGLVWRKNSSHSDEFVKFGEFIQACRRQQQG